MIRLRSVCKSFGRNTVLNNVSIEVADGEKIAITGPSGCGKTTLLNLVAGLESVDSGEIYIDGEIASSFSIRRPPYLRSIGFLFQQAALWPHMTVSDNIGFVINASDQGQKQKDIDELLEVLKLDGMEDHYPDELSGGQQQRVALARALASKPRHLLLDEPFNHLDQALKLQLTDVINRFLEAGQISLLYVTHAVEKETLSLDRVIDLNVYSGQSTA